MSVAVLIYYHFQLSVPLISDRIYGWVALIGGFKSDGCNQTKLECFFCFCFVITRIKRYQTHPILKQSEFQASLNTQKQNAKARVCVFSCYLISLPHANHFWTAQHSPLWRGDLGAEGD